MTSFQIYDSKNCLNFLCLWNLFTAIINRILTAAQSFIITNFCCPQKFNLHNSLNYVNWWKSLNCPTLCDAMDYTIHGILQARIQEWVAFPFSRGSSQPRDWAQVSRIAGRSFTSWATRQTPREVQCTPNPVSSNDHSLHNITTRKVTLVRRVWMSMLLHNVWVCITIHHQDQKLFSCHKDLSPFS